MEAVFDKEGSITNLEELTVDEVATAYSEKNRSIFGRLTEEETKRKQVEADLAKTKADLESKKNNPQELEEATSIKEKVNRLELIEKKRQFGYENGLSPEETDRVFMLNPNPSKETLEDPFVKGGLESIRSKKKLESNMPGVSPGSIHIADGKNMEELRPDEKQVEFDKYLSAKGLK